MRAHILVINCGSSSIKFQIMDPNTKVVVFKGLAENIGSKRCRIKYGDQKLDLAGAGYTLVLENIIKLLHPYEHDLAAIGHRVVHGGEFFSTSVLINKDVIKKIKECGHLAPLHNPVNALGIEVFIKKYPSLPNVAVFDTAFHMTLPEHAYLYPLPYDYYKNFQVRKYGFHGSSHRFISSQIKTHFSTTSKIIIAHLGNGCSVCAIKDGKSVDTSMGFTPLEGLMMGTRSGDIDPSIGPFLGKALDIDNDKVMHILNKESGLKGVSELSGDMRILEEKAIEGDKQSILAIKIFCYRLAKYIMSYQVPLGGCDGLVFTGGIGENSPYIRSIVIDMLPHFSLDQKLNDQNTRGKEGLISTKQSIPVAVIPTNEELLIAQDTDTIRKGL